MINILFYGVKPIKICHFESENIFGVLHFPSFETCKDFERKSKHSNTVIHGILFIKSNDQIPRVMSVVFFYILKVE